MGTDAREQARDDAGRSGRDIHVRELSRLVEEHTRALHAFLLTRVRDEQEARDVAQEAYVRLLQLDNPGAISFLRAYLFKTAANVALNRAKQRALRRRIDDLDRHEERIERVTPERSVLAEEEVQVLRRALFELPPRCRRAFVLHRFMEWDVEKIAAELGVGARMVRNYLLQAGLYCQLRVRGLSPADARAKVPR